MLHDLLRLRRWCAHTCTHTHTHADTHSYFTFWTLIGTFNSLSHSHVGLALIKGHLKPGRPQSPPHWRLEVTSCFITKTRSNCALKSSLIGFAHNQNTSLSVISSFNGSLFRDDDQSWAQCQDGEPSAGGQQWIPRPWPLTLGSISLTSGECFSHLTCLFLLHSSPRLFIYLFILSSD